ncbi:MAG TPA: ComEC/Rec2 family competence protein [Bacteroidia bacterium]|nr:ComEC/Rec2 family competence protein [Bacteroidia bacterium]
MGNNFWQQVPFLRLLPAVLCGILTAIYAHFIPVPVAWFVSLSLVLSLSTFIVFRKYFSNHRLRWVSGIHFYFLLFFFYYVLTLENTASLDPLHFQDSVKEAKAFIGYLNEEPIEKYKSRKAEIIITEVKTKVGWKKCRGKILAYINRDSLSQKLSYGDVISFSSVPLPTEPPKNPNQFNYKRYLHFHQIEHQVYLPSGKWISLRSNSGNPVLRFAIGVRKKLLDIYKHQGISGREFAVLSALTLGYVDEIDDETKRAFSASGAMHVLSVSGQHVGIIFIGLTWLLFFLERGKWRKIIQAVLLLLLIWCYVIITGLSPAVLRAGTMITFIIVGKMMRSNTNIFNTIAVSAIFLMAFNPNLIMEVGFQLSYLAVSGIVLIQPWVYKQLFVRNRILDAIWKLTSISLAAQLATFPLGLLYFQQFPNYFIFSNLIVIPLATIIIYGGIVLLLAGSWIPSVTVWIAVAVDSLTWFLNAIVTFIEKLPYSIMSGIAIDIFQTWVIYVIIASLCFFIAMKNIFWLRISLALFAFYLALWLNDSRYISGQKQMVVYNVKGNTAIQLTEGRNSILIADSALLNNESSYIFNISRNVYHLGIASLEKIISDDLDGQKIRTGAGIYLNGNFIFFDGRKYFIADEMPDIKFVLSRRITMDAVIVTNKSVRNISSLLNNFSFQKLIVASSVPDWLSKKLQAQCAEKNIACYSVSEKGAYIESN